MVTSTPGSHFIVDARFWMPYHIFNINPADVKSVSVTVDNPPYL
ncbi:MAG: hypothetical protein R2744_10570 [Bacteroidales bacterium]